MVFHAPEEARFREACEGVRERATQTLEWLEREALDLLSIALDHLTLGRAHLGVALTLPAGFTEAAEHLDRAVDGLRQAGTEHRLPLGLLARAALCRVRAARADGDATADLDAAATDLQEAQEGRLDEGK